MHLFKCGSSCRDAVDRNRKALFARAHIRSVRPSVTHTLRRRLLRTAIAREIYDEEGKDTESP